MYTLKERFGKTFSFKELQEAYLFILPLFIFIALFIFLPVIGTFINSLFRDVSFLKREFLFLENYKRLLMDISFWQAFSFTFLFILISVPLEIFLGLSFALILNIKLPMQGFLRASVLIPWAIPSAISARIWQLIYNYHYGLLNFLCLKLGIINEPVNWLGTDLSAFVSLVIADVYKTTPFVAIILLAGLQAIPEHLYAQAKVDRANFSQIFYRITLPLLKPVLVVAFLFRTIDALRIFDLIYVLTGGGPGGATTSLSLYSYKYFLSGDFGYGATVSVILFIISFIFSIFYIRRGSFYQRLGLK